MNVLHISTADQLGGSARSAWKIHTGLRALGATSRMLVRIRDSADPDVAAISHGALKLADRAANKLTGMLGLQYCYFPSTALLHRHRWFREADVVQCYNLHGGYFSFRALPRLSRLKPLVWRLSDMWPMTGHCSFPGDCERWRTGCGQCPDLPQYPGLPFDTSALLFRLKQGAYARSRLHIVAPSSWIGEQAQRSPLLGQFPLHTIPNGIDPVVFTPRDRAACRRELGIPTDRFMVLVLAHDFRRGTRKGLEFALDHVWQSPDMQERQAGLMLVGKGAATAEPGLPGLVWRHDLVSDDRRLATIYAAADLYLHPAVFENLPNTIIEAMACGTPAVAFDTGGVKDVVHHRRTGYLARYRDGSDLLAGVLGAIAAPAELAAWRQAGLELIAARFTHQAQAAAFLALYQELAGSHG